ncbi:NAD(P)-binding protein [uncultured Roseobacter sp.]|uniref:NAD(P)/FAD-dependent oxidoreductase n=1 Tax=uncultured Roseobacter sp. TaxID=114847 RepID=UPI00262AD9CD|nr:NAD(P)-binding protein [uncultured Roseobacter sp.]
MAGRPEIAVIGAGLAGVRLAGLLRDVATVKIFEKSRGTGGRMSTRRAEGFQFDHGAQYFTARGEAFRAFLAPFIASGTVAEWKPRLRAAPSDRQTDELRWNASRYVGVPAMNSLCKAAAGALAVAHGDAVRTLHRHADGWKLELASGEEAGPFAAVLSTAPAVQTAALLPQEMSGRAALEGARMLGCYSLMCGFVDLPDLGWDALVCDGSPLAWIAAGHSRPGRTDAAALLCQTSNAWAEENLERDQQDIQQELLSALADATGLNTDAASYVSLHRWRYAAVQTPAGRPCLFDPDLGVGAAGDWCEHGRVEAAFDSAEALAAEVKSYLARKGFR